MKKTIIFLTVLLLTAALLLCTVSCGASGSAGEDTGKNNDTQTPLTFERVWNAVTETLADADKLVDVQDSYLKNFIKANPDDYAAYKVCVQSISTSIDEIGIFEAKNTDDVKTIEKMLEDYLDFYRNEIWDDRYIQEEYPKLRDAEVISYGNYVMYTILDEGARASAVEAFSKITK